MLTSQKMRQLAPELDPLRLGTGWKPEDLSKPQVIIESTAGDSHPGSGHLNILVEEVCKGVAEAGGFTAKPRVAPAPAGTYRVGDTVAHKAFGVGMIVSATPMANDTLLEVAFDKVGTKKLFANFARLTKV